MVTHRMRPAHPVRAHARVTVLPVATTGLVTAGVWIARSIVLAIRVGIELGAVSRIGDDAGESRRRSRECSGDDQRRANQSEFYNFSSSLLDPMNLEISVMFRHLEFGNVERKI